MAHLEEDPRLHCAGWDPVVTLASLQDSLRSREAGGFKTESSFRFIPLFYTRINWISQSKSYFNSSSSPEEDLSPGLNICSSFPPFRTQGFMERESGKR